VAREGDVVDEEAGMWRDVRLCVEEVEGMVEEVCQVDQLDRYLVWLQYLQQLWWVRVCVCMCMCVCMRAYMCACDARLQLTIVFILHWQISIIRCSMFRFLAFFLSLLNKTFMFQFCIRNSS